MPAASVSDFRERARRRLPHRFFEYIDGGAYSETTLGRNIADLEAIALRQRVMVDTTKLDLSVEVMGQKMALPFGLAPIGMGGMYRRRGEVQAARAAAEAGVPFCLSTLSVCAIEEVAAVAPPWFQLYMLRDRGYMREVIARAKAVACPVLVFTVDLPTPGARYRDIRSGFTGSSGPGAWLRQAWDGASHPAWVWDVWLHGRPHVLGNVAGALPEGKKQVGDFLAWISRNFDRGMTWADMDWVREHWDGPILVKGVLDAADARDAVKAGAQGLVVSNHGGRQLDGVKSSIAALPRIADAVGNDLDLLLDGGVRSGLDVLKALSLGAKATLIGRAWVYALAAEGQAGVAQALSIMRSELAVAMILTGCTSARDASRALLDLD